MTVVDYDAVAPLLEMASSEPEPEQCLAILQTAAHFPLEEDAWQALAQETVKVVRNEPRESQIRQRALELAVEIPLLSLRQYLRDLAQDPAEPHRKAILEALGEVRDPSCLTPALAAAQRGDGDAFELLAALPLEEKHLSPDMIPALSPADETNSAAFWRALALARLGDFSALDAYLDGRVSAPPLFWGDPWTTYDAIAQIRPIPSRMRERLLTALERFEGEPAERLVKLTAWAATGIADAQGCPLVDEDLSVERDTETLADEAEASQEREAARLMVETIEKGNRNAASMDPQGLEFMSLGNHILESIPRDVPPRSWPVAELALSQLQAERPVLDDDQMAWVIAHGEPPRVIHAFGNLLAPLRKRGEQTRLLPMLGRVADHFSGRAFSPFRGAAGGGAAASPSRGRLIDDTFHEAMTPRKAGIVTPPELRRKAKVSRSVAMDRFTTLSATSATVEDIADELEMAAAKGEEERCVQARILYEGKPRNTFVTGSDNVIRCWIGLPQPETAAADQPIPRIDIPPEGLPLTAVLSWGDQTDSRPLLLPAARDARTGDCNLHIRIPEGERYVCVDIAFLYRGRAFEVVQVQAFALAPGEAEQPHQDIQVRVQLSRREVIELTDSNKFNATLYWGEDRARPGQDPDGASAKTSLRVFNERGAGRYDLSEADNAIKWVNDSLFTTEKTLVRRRAAQGGEEDRPMLDADDPQVLSLLRDMARHGATLYNALSAQGFEDPGARIQLLNRDPRGYVPLEFVYDRGYPSDDAKLCDGWQAALMSDDDACPVCGQETLTLEQRDRVATICPLGFWSLQKVIERLDPSTPDEYIAAPCKERSALPSITHTVFASSHRVPAQARELVWQCLSEHFDQPRLAEAWGQWKETLRDRPQLLVMLPHHGVQAALDYLEIGDEQLPVENRRLSLGQLTPLYVNPKHVAPGPIVLLLGCQTGAQTETGYVSLVRRFQQLETSIVVGTLAKILGRHAAPVASEFITQLLAVENPEADFGTIMRRVRRRMLADGYLMALCLVALGDAEWRLTPRT